MDPVYVTISINGTNEAQVLSTAATIFYNSLGLLHVLVFALVISSIIFMVDIILRLTEKKNYKNGDQSQIQQLQIQAQVSSTQQSNTNGIFVEYKTLNIIKSALIVGISFIMLIFVIAATAGLFAIDTFEYQIALALIFVLAVLGIPILYDGYNQVNKLLPKRIKKIVKVTTIYEDGTTIEREKKYEY